MVDGGIPGKEQVPQFRSDTAPTLNVFDVGDVRATTIIVEPPVTFAWQNGGGYKNSAATIFVTQTHWDERKVGTQALGGRAGGRRLA